MKFVADLHVHSRFSRATSRNLDLEHLYIAAQQKGISVVGTGDFTHPGWFSELSEKLEPAEPGLFRLSDELARGCDQQVPGACRRPVRFILSTEISNIYKKEEKTRKNHNLVFFPSFDSARLFIGELDRIGNIHSDGRPILGLDARDLLEIVLETSEHGFLVPAHIWTPWFSVLGSKSGFDSIEQCFGDLSEHIFAVETGLSSDPPMNWRVSQLDGRALISNSDAHSPQKLGREANLFDSQISYYDIRSALVSGDPRRFLGTIEFYPEEGKYHFDGHRKCGLRLHPRDSEQHNEKCPVCSRPLTLGVLHRVEQLADRPEGHRPKKSHPFVHLIPLVEVLADLFGVGTGTKKVRTAYHQLLERFGSEDFILRNIETELLSHHDGIPLLGEAITRVRENRVDVRPGYDGEFGRICIFDPGERKALLGQRNLFSSAPGETQNRKTKKPIQTKNRGDAKPIEPAQAMVHTGTNSLLASLNTQQRDAVTRWGCPLLIVAGPGTGKTRTLTHRIGYLILQRNVEPARILAVTFTQKAASEMRDRLHALLGRTASLPTVATFHSYCMQILTYGRPDSSFRVIDEYERLEWIRRAAAFGHHRSSRNDAIVKKMADGIAVAKQQLQTADDLSGNPDRQMEEIAAVYRRYQHLLAIQQLVDYEDLIANGIRLLESEGQGCPKLPSTVEHVLVDEYQDLNYGQYRMVQALAARGAQPFVIGDPDQAIYGFRGADVRFFHSFLQDFPGADQIRLDTNYRSCQSILDASQQMISAGSVHHQRQRIYSGIMGTATVGVVEAASEKAEAVAVGKSIEQLVGGMGFHSMDFGKVDAHGDRKAFGFADIAVLFRTARQGDLLAQKLSAAGIPCQLTTARHMRREKGLLMVWSVFRLLEGVGSYLDLELAAPYLHGDLKAREIKQLIQYAIEHGCSIHQVFDIARRLPLTGLATSSQRKIVELKRRLEAYRSELSNMAVPDRLEALIGKLHRSQDDDGIRSLQYKIAHLRSFGGSFLDSHELISQLSLQTDTDRYNPRVERVALLTMHAAKGLEFPVVYVSGCEDELIPFRRSERKVNDIDEERRLFYVAMTRAKEMLFLTYCRKRMIFGHSKARQPSPFLVDIENRLKSHRKTPNNRYRKKRPDQLRLF